MFEIVRSAGRRAVSAALRSRGVELVPIAERGAPVEYSQAEAEVLDYVFRNKLTMCSPARVIATMDACRHVSAHGVPGEFVECGTWRGGNAIAAAKVLSLQDSPVPRKIVLYDTFDGMTEPTEKDSSLCTGNTAESEAEQRGYTDYSQWSAAGLEEVRGNFQEAGIAMEGVVFCPGDIAQTLTDPENIPSEISVLRLDTDWYESTLMELEVLYPRLSRHGVLLLDDYGSWAGAKQAVDEYFAEGTQRRASAAWFSSDRDGRMLIKLA